MLKKIEKLGESLIDAMMPWLYIGLASIFMLGLMGLAVLMFYWIVSMLNGG